jgi:pyridoxal phosphate enzyme (YggS family)
MNLEVYNQIFSLCKDKNTTLIAVSKTKTALEIMQLYDLGQRDFGENKVQELVGKFEALPKDICWHQIGHLQTNKVKHIAPFVHLIHSVDSIDVLHEINKQAQKLGRIIPCLFQIYIANEDTKFGFDPSALLTFLESEVFKQLNNIKIRGLMGMATFTDNEDQIKKEFAALKSFFDLLKSTHFDNDIDFSVLSMGMSSDYNIAILEGSNMIRVGSLLFGSRA